MAAGSESAIERMRTQAERAMASSKSRNTVLPLLERLARAAPEGSETSTFAHRHLAEYLVEQHPWRALLHLRKVLGLASVGGSKGTTRPERHAPAVDDDGAHALAGLAHALLGNYHAAVASYRRAVTAAPRNPWYQHNLGHLLDVGLDRPTLALRHLETAHRAAGPDDGEISASLAHCLARLGQLDAALGHVEVAIATSPENAEHQRLRTWILSGAKEDPPRAEARPAPEGAPPKKRTRKPKAKATATTSVQETAPSSARRPRKRAREADPSAPRPTR